MLTVNGLVKGFGSRTILNHIDFEVPKGKAFVLLGPSGCGKSVLLKCILGLLKPDSGEICIEGQDITKLTFKAELQMRLRFGMLFQNSALFDSLTVGENVGFGLMEHSRLPIKEIWHRVHNYLKMVGLEGIEKQMPAQLSGGMRKRVALARAISMEPEYLLYDEPTAGLDPVTGDAVNRLMVQLKTDLQVTCIAVTHDMSTAFALGDEIGLLHKGELVFKGSPASFRASQDPAVTQYSHRS